MEAYDFLLFDGSLAACQDSAFGTEYRCAFSTREDAEKAIRARDDVVIARHFAPHRIGSMSPLSVTHTVAGASSPATVPPTPSVSTPGNAAISSSSAMQKNHNDESPEKRARNEGHVLGESSSITTDADDVMKRAQLLVKKCYEEVQELLVLEEKNKIAGRQWAEMRALDVKKKTLLEMSLAAFESEVAKKEHNVDTCLRAFCEKMIALVPDHTVSIWKDISSLDRKK